MAKQLQAAHQGDPKARQWCLEQGHRVRVPAPKLKLPPIQTLDDIAQAQSVILEAVANRTYTAADGQALMAMLEGRRKTIETQDLVPRMEELERLMKTRRD